MKNNNLSKAVASLGVAALLSIGFVSSVFAEVPGTINYQGYLTDGSGNPVTATESMTFSIYATASGGTALWSEFESVPVSNGTFTNQLGDSTAFPVGLFNGQDLYVGVKVGADPEMVPRKPVTSAPYAFKSAMADTATLADTATQADNATTLAGLAASTYDQSTEVTAVQAQADSNSTRLDSIEATDADITAVVAGAGLNGGATSGGAELSLAAGGVQASNMAFNSVSGGALQANAVTTGKILDSTISPSDMDTSGLFTNLDADLLDGQQASEIIEAASDEVRTPISSVPISINQSGSYYLTENLSHTNAAVSAINVIADNVTINMMGFTLSGPGKTSGTSNSGILINDQTNVTVMNGTVRGFGANGIVEVSSFGDLHRLIDVQVIDNGGSGIFLRGGNHQVRNCSAQDNGTIGIFSGPESLLTHNIAANNGTTGIQSTSYSILTHNTVSNSQSDGIIGGQGTIILSNTVQLSQGIQGIFGGFGSKIINNNVFSNAQWGIFADGGNLIKGNTIIFNNIDNAIGRGGLRVNNDSRVVDNLLDSNREHNIYVQNADNVLDGNHVTDAVNAAGNGTGYGIFFQSSDNFFRNNTATGNANASDFGGSVPPASRNINNVSW